MRENKVLRTISYIILPITVFIFIVSSVAFVFSANVNYRSKAEYFYSGDFLDLLLGRVSDIADDLIHATDENYFSIDDGTNKIFEDSDHFSIKIKDFKYIAVYNNKVLTNMNIYGKNLSLLIDEIREIEKNQAYFEYTNNQLKASNEQLNKKLQEEYSFLNRATISYYTIEESENPNQDIVLESSLIQPDTNALYEVEGNSYEVTDTVPIESLEPEEIQEIQEQQEIEEFSNSTQKILYKKARLSDFDFYITYDENFEGATHTEIAIKLLEMINPYKDVISIITPISFILSLIIAIYLINSIGHTKGKTGVELNDFDKIPFEILLLAFLICFAICGLILDEVIDRTALAGINLEKILLLIVSFYFINVVILEISVVSFIKRIKAKKLVETSISGKIIVFLIKIIKKVSKKAFAIIKKVYKNIVDYPNVTVKVIVYCLIVILIAMFGPVGIAVDLAIVGYTIYWLLVRIKSFKRFEEKLKKVSEGTLEDRINVSEYPIEFKKSVEYLNSISNGFETAIDESMKSERMKTELITNVSHDIKTPLTSIINYVDLLKKENIKGKKANEYLEILDSKSQRLKKLTEDLVEASKASSGNLKLDLKQINIIELINQALGEFEEKFKEKNLEIIPKYEKQTINIKADSKYMYRVVENLFSNISKYALEKSRVYIDVRNENSETILEFKNISKERLNITEEELMQRFVRGDKSRTSDGSGLGLAIAKSLIDLQGGKLICKIDGDLFKIEIRMKWI